MYSDIVWGQSWHPTEGTDVPWAWAPLIRTTEFPSHPILSERMNADRTAIRLTRSTRGTYRGFRSVNAPVWVRFEPGTDKAVIEVTKPSLVVSGAFRPIAREMVYGQAEYGSPAVRWAARPYRVTLPPERKTDMYRHLEEMLSWDKASPFPPPTLTHMQRRRLSDTGPLPPEIKGLMLNDTFYLQSPYMTKREKYEHLRNNVMSMFYRREESENDVVVSRLGRTIDHFLELDMPREKPLDDFAQIAERKLPRHDLTQFIYNWTGCDQNTYISPNATYLWYTKFSIYGLVYACKGGISEHTDSPRIDLGPYLRQLEAEEEILLLRNSETHPKMITVANRYFSPSWNETRDAADAATAPAKRETWHLVCRNLFLRDKITHDLLDPSRIDTGTIRLKILKTFIWN